MIPSQLVSIILYEVTISAKDLLDPDLLFYVDNPTSLVDDDQVGVVYVALGKGNLSNQPYQPYLPCHLNISQQHI